MYSMKEVPSVTVPLLNVLDVRFGIKTESTGTDTASPIAIDGVASSRSKCQREDVGTVSPNNDGRTGLVSDA